jgi:macrolide transport system ATP-binding/permease protein
VIRACGVGVSYGSVRAVSDVSLTLAPGLTVLSGPSGAGKSTLLRVLSLVERPSVGEVFVRDVATSSRRCVPCGARRSRSCSRTLRTT